MISTNNGALKGGVIELTNGGRQFLISHAKLVDYVAVSGWVRFSERFTSAPRLHDKIGGTNLRRGAVSHWRDLLLEMQGRECFYGANHEMTSPEVDHLLPWSFVLEDKTWNLVITCRKCNNDKRDRLPNVTAMERLCVRNDSVVKELGRTNPAFGRQFLEWHSRDLPGHIRRLYDQAAADGFPKWQ